MTRFLSYAEQNYAEIKYTLDFCFWEVNFLCFSSGGWSFCGVVTAKKESNLKVIVFGLLLYLAHATVIELYLTHTTVINHI